MNQQLIDWKTNAWKDPGMVANYARRMEDVAGGVQIKNRIEVGLTTRFAAGTDVLDVGIGTGRASLPLARAGVRVTGVDSSQSMLDKTRELAGATPIQLVAGDVAALPFEAGRFDTLMSLNTIAHFPHWTAILREWDRVVRPGGRMVFDMFAMDHDLAVAAARGVPPETFGPKGTADYYTRITAAELVDACNTLGLAIVDAVPYGSLFGLPSVQYWFDSSLATGHLWDRLLSWSNAVPHVFDFAVFLEEHVLSHLGTASSGRFMAVLEKRSDPAGNTAWLERNAQKSEALRGGLTASSLHACGVDAAALRTATRAFLAHSENRIVLFRLLTAAIERRWRVSLNELLAPEHVAAILDLLRRESIDREVLDLLARFAGDPHVAAQLTFRGVPLASVFRYDAMVDILDRGLHTFEVSDS